MNKTSLSSCANEKAYGFIARYCADRRSGAMGLKMVVKSMRDVALSVKAQPLRIGASLLARTIFTALLILPGKTMGNEGKNVFGKPNGYLQ